MFKALKRWRPSWDWELIYIFGLLGLVFAFIWGVIFLQIYLRDDTTFELLASNWECTRSSSQIITWGYTGTTPFPIMGTVCEEYSRK